MAVRNSTVVTILQQDEELCEAVVSLVEPLQNYCTVLDQTDGLVRPHLKPAGDGARRISGADMRWMFSKRKEVMDCRTRLEATKSTFDVALACINLLCHLRSAARYAATPSSPETLLEERNVEAGSMLQEYTESIVH